VPAVPPTIPNEIDERFIAEWFWFGLREMRAYMLKHARFAQWCRDRGQEPW
jgi:hypothetical protein